MAIYHCAAKVISRSAGRSAVAAAAYRAGADLYDERLETEHCYAKKKGVVHSEIMAPPDAPAWVLERQSLWNAVEASEKRRDSQLARDFDLALPVELSLPQRLALVRGFVQEQFVDRGMVADYSIHEDNPQNPHCHLMTTMRTIDAEGFGLKARAWNDKDLLQAQRAAWSDHVNRALEQAGHDARVDHRSLQDQGVEDRLPQIHLGVAAAGMIERAARNETILEHPRVDQFREIQQFNDRVVDLDREIAQERARLEASAERQRLEAEAVAAERIRLEAEAAVEKARLAAAAAAERQRLEAEAAAEKARLAAEVAAEAERQRLEAAAAAEKARLEAEAVAAAEKARLAAEAERVRLEAEVEAERQRLEAEAAALAEKTRLAAERQQQTAQREAWGWAMTKVAAAVLRAVQHATYEGKHYRFGYDGKTLTIAAKDGRGVLVSRQGDQLLFVSEQITEADRDYFQAQGQALQQRLPTLDVSPPPPTDPKTTWER